VRRPNSESSATAGRHGSTGPGAGDEFALIDRLAEGFADGPVVLAPGDLGIGDDAAAVTLPHPGRVVLTTDLVVEGVHVDLATSSPEDVGWKALMVAVSDLAAMGATPSYALLSVAAPAGFPVERLGTGVAGAARTAGCRVVGGDLSGAPVLVVSVAAVGSVPDDGAPLLRRGGARPGDWLVVTGALGASAAGRRILAGAGGTEASGPQGRVPVAAALVATHRRPVARLVEGDAARRAGASAAVDVSDGLVADVRHLAEASGVGLELVVGEAVVTPGATRDDALFGGEDYELVVATGDPDGLRDSFAAAGLRTPIPIGRCTGRTGVFTLDGAALPEGGWRHRF
jgi:thiamine-monophosphate kinase